MDMVEAQLEESDIQVELTADNYKEELDQLMAEDVYKRQTVMRSHCLC